METAKLLKISLCFSLLVVFDSSAYSIEAENGVTDREITGVVVDDDGAVSGAHIYLIGQQVVAETTTGKSGKFEIQFSSNSILQILVLSDGKSAHMQFVDRDQSDIAIKLSAPSTPPSGRIIDNQGHGVSSCELRIVGFQHVDSSVVVVPDEIDHPALLTTTDRDGAFQFNSVDANTVSSVRVSGKGIVTSFINQPTSKDALIHVVQPSRIIRGIVVDKKSKSPLPNIAVSAATDQAITDATGRFELDGLPAFAPNVLFAKPNGKLAYLPRSESVLPELGFEAANIEISLDRAVWIESKVRDFADNGPANAQLFYIPTQENEKFRSFLEEFQLRGALPSQSTDFSGDVRLTAITGPGIVAVYSNQYPPNPSVSKLSQEQQNLLTQITNRNDLIAVEFVEIENLEDRVELEFLVSKGRNIAVSIRNAETEDINNLIVHNLASTTSPSRIVSAPIFSVEQLHPGDVRKVFIHAPTKQLGAVVDIAAEKSGPVSVDLCKTGSVVGRILNEDGEPQSGLKVTFEFVGDKMTQEISAPIFTDTNGRFEKYSLLANLEYRITAIRMTTSSQMMQGLPEADSKWTLSDGLAINSDEVVDLGDLTLNAISWPEPSRYARKYDLESNSQLLPSVVSGTVLNPDGDPISDAVISLNTWRKRIDEDDVDLQCSPIVLSQSLSDASGNFQMVIDKSLANEILKSSHGLNACLVVSAKKYGATQIPILDVGEQQNLWITLEREMLLRGRLRDAGTNIRPQTVALSSYVRVFNKQKIQNVLTELKNGASLIDAIKTNEPDAILDPLAGGLPANWAISPKKPFRVHGMPLNAIFELTLIDGTSKQSWYVVSRPIKPFEFKVNSESTVVNTIQGSRISIDLNEQKSGQVHE